MNHKPNLTKIIQRVEELKLDPDQLKDLIEDIKYPGLRTQKSPVDLSKLVEKGKIRLGVVGDTQLNSIGYRGDCLHALYKFFKDERVHAVLHPGDFTDGFRRYEGHTSEVYCLAYNETVKFIAEEYPNVGIPTYFIGGNNDRTYLTKLKKFKRDICVDIAECRKDLHYLGMNYASLRLENIIIDLIHPIHLNRGAYTISYPLQNLIGAYKSGRKPDILLAGGYHKLYELPEWREIESFLVCSTADPTPTMIAKRHGSDCAGLILHLDITKEGDLGELKVSKFPFYR